MMYENLKKICIDVLGYYIGDNKEPTSGKKQIRAAYDFLVYDELRDIAIKELDASCATCTAENF